METHVVRRVALLGVIVVVFLSLCAGIALCSEPETSNEEIDSTEALIILLRKKGIISEETGDFLLRHREGEMTEKQREDILERLKRLEAEIVPQERIKRIEDLAQEKPEWINRLKPGGDFRFRYQGDYFDPENKTIEYPEESDKSIKNKKDRDRVRMRLRLSLTAQVNDKVDVAARLATGNERDPVSTNETLGDYYNKDGVVFDQAYLRWRPLNQLSAWCGRMPNPFISTDLVWDSDVNLEGLALTLGSLKVPPIDSMDIFLSAGAFPIHEIQLSSKDKWLYAGQIGIRQKPASFLGYTIACAYYDYRNVQGEFTQQGENPEANPTPLVFRQWGNTVFDVNSTISGSDIKMALASDFNQLNIYGAVDVELFSPVVVQFIADYVKNVGFDETDARRRVGSEVGDQTEGYQVGMLVGHRRVDALWKWNFSLFFKHLEADAVLDAFTDSDFHQGGTDAEGWVLRAQLGLAKNTWLTLSWLSADEISPKYSPYSVDVLQADISAGF